MNSSPCLSTVPTAAAAVPVHFFGAETHFSSAPTLLWQHTGADVIPAFVLQKPGGRYVSLLAPPVPMDADGVGECPADRHGF